MAKAKMENFSAADVYAADIAKALSHPARIRIMKILTSMDVCMCGDIVELLPLAQSTVSQHLKELKRVGLIQGEIEGPKTCYCLDADGFTKAKKIMDEFFISIKKGDLSCKTKKK